MKKNALIFICGMATTMLCLFAVAGVVFMINRNERMKDKAQFYFQESVSRYMMEEWPKHGEKFFGVWSGAWNMKDGLTNGGNVQSLLKLSGEPDKISKINGGVSVHEYFYDLDGGPNGVIHIEILDGKLQSVGFGDIRWK